MFHDDKFVGKVLFIDMGTDSESSGGSRARSLALKALILFGGVLILKRLRKSTTRWDHARNVAESLSGEKVTTSE